MRRHAMMGVVCGSARTSPHNFVFLEELKPALTTDPLWQDERQTLLDVQYTLCAAIAVAIITPRGVVTPLSHWPTAIG
jgi:hypothetical protein